MESKDLKILFSRYDEKYPQVNLGILILYKMQGLRSKRQAYLNFGEMHEWFGGSKEEVVLKRDGLEMGWTSRAFKLL